MKISYDPEVDALSITFRETTVTTKHLAEGIAARRCVAWNWKALALKDPRRLWIRSSSRDPLKRYIVKADEKFVPGLFANLKSQPSPSAP